jgi:DNA-binding transcriptional regulator GbsR (MarR family)
MAHSLAVSRDDEVSPGTAAGASGEMDHGAHEFIEGMGVYFAQFDLPRIFGRLVGLLMVSERPLAHEEIARTLGVARGSVSTNMRLALALDLAERVAVRGDRRDFYRQTGDPWGRSLDAKVAATMPLQRMAERALQALPPDHLEARARMADLIDFCEFFETEREGLVRRWKERLAARGRPADPKVG